jgi:histidinol-phosphate aminotransferase
VTGAGHGRSRTVGGAGTRGGSLGAMTGPRLRPELADVPAYRAGLPAPVGAFKISSNENPYAPLPSVIAAIAAAAAQANRYPDFSSARLVQALAKRFTVPAGHVAVGTGSVGVAQQLIQAVAGPGDEVLFAWRSFEAYPIISRVGGATPVTVPLDAEQRHDLQAMLAAVTGRTRLVFVCNPNNPTGTAVRRDELEAFLAAVPGDVLVVLDEAYREFVTDPQVPDGIELYRDRPNVCVLRTFSKAYGLAALRVGFVVAHTAVAQAARKTAVPFGVSTLAQEAAVASLAAEGELLERVRSLVAERDRVSAALLAQGWQVPASQANFVWLGLGARTAQFAAACAEAGAVVRAFDGDGVRVTVAEPAATAAFLEVSARFAPDRAAAASD